jgi:hypothetical protein
MLTFYDPCTWRKTISSTAPIDASILVSFNFLYNKDNTAENMSTKSADSNTHLFAVIRHLFAFRGVHNNLHTIYECGPR